MIWFILVSKWKATLIENDISKDKNSPGFNIKGDISFCVWLEIQKDKSGNSWVKLLSVGCQSARKA